MLLRCYGAFPGEQEIKSEEQGSDTYTRVGDIESWPMILAGVNQDEIYHIAKSNSIHQVAADAC